MDKHLVLAGGFVLLLFIFGVPAVLVPVSMSNISERSRIKVIILHEQVVKTARANFKRHQDPGAMPGRLTPLPQDSMAWIKLINPTGRQAPGGGQALLFEADDQTGAIGIQGDERHVVVTMPAFAGLSPTTTVIVADPEVLPAP